MKTKCATIAVKIGPREIRSVFIPAGSRSHPVLKINYGPKELKKPRRIPDGTAAKVTSFFHMPWTRAITPPTRKGTHVTVKGSRPSLVNFFTKSPPAPNETPVKATKPQTFPTELPRKFKIGIRVPLYTERRCRRCLTKELALIAGNHECVVLIVKEKN